VTALAVASVTVWASSSVQKSSATESATESAVECCRRRVASEAESAQVEGQSSATASACLWSASRCLGAPSTVES